MAKQAKAKKRRKKSKLTPEERKARHDQRRFQSDIRRVFLNCAFEQVPVRGVDLDVENWTGEFDALFVFENVLVFVEDTTEKNPADHLRKKVDYYSHITKNRNAFFEALRSASVRLEEFFSANDHYSVDEWRVKFVYCSRHTIEEDVRGRFENMITFLEYPHLQYFLALSKTIQRSARFELFKFLSLEMSSIGHSSSAKSSTDYQGLLLTEAPSGFPAGNKIVSFLVDPAMLLAQSYVLRADGWQDTECLYQRLLVRSKIRDMRAYLAEERRVFINNIIVTLPDDAEITTPTGEPVELDGGSHIRPVRIRVPQRFNTIGVIDGQHRIFCYHEGNDGHDKNIKVFREKQHLLVTGILSKGGMSTARRQRFEAQLFLEINDKQKRVKGDLKQAIEMVIDPTSSIAIAKAVINKMAVSGPLANVLESHFYDKHKIKTTSIVSYGLRYIVDIENKTHSFYAKWKHAGKASIQTDQDVQHEYVKYCVGQLNQLFNAFKSAIPEHLWTTDRKSSRALNATSINGVIYCMRRMLEDGRLSNFDDYKQALKRMTVNFQPGKFKYKSSHWKTLGDRIYEECFGDSKKT